MPRRWISLGEEGSDAGGYWYEWGTTKEEPEKKKPAKPVTSTLTVDRPETTDDPNLNLQNGANMGSAQPGGGGNLAVQTPEMGATDTGMADFQPPAPVTTPPPTQGSGSSKVMASYLDPVPTTDKKAVIESQLPYDAGPKTGGGKRIGESYYAYQQSPTYKGLDKEYTEIIGEEDINALIGKFESNIASGTVGNVPSLPTIKVTAADGTETEEELIYGQERDPYTGGPSGLEGYGYIEKVPAGRPQTQEVDTYTHVETGESLSLAQLREHPDFASEKRWDPNLSDHQWMKQMEDQGVTDWAHSVETQTVQTPVLDQFGAQAFDEKFVITAATQAAGAAYERSLQLLDVQRDFVQKQQAAVNEYERAKLFEEFQMEIRDRYSEIEQERRNEQANLDREDRQKFEDAQRRAGQTFERFDREDRQRFEKGEREASQEYQDEVREWEKQFAMDIADYEREQNLKFNESERAAIDKWEKEKFEREFAARAGFETSEREATQTWQDAQRVFQNTFSREERQATQTWEREFQLELETARRAHDELMATTSFSHQSQLQQDAQYSRDVEAARERSFRALESSLGRELTRTERQAAEEYATAASALEDQRRIADREDRQAFETGERVAGQEYQTGQIQAGQQFQTGERVAGQEFQTGERATERAWQGQEANLQRNFQILRDTTDFDRTSLLESARLGIADATSPEGIARAVELAKTARDREKTLAALDVIERIASNPQAAFALSNSGLLGALGTEFGLDLSFIGGMAGTQSVLSGNLLPPASDFARMPIDQQRAQLNAISAATGVAPEDIRLEIIRRAQGGGLATGSDAYATRATV